MQLNCSQVYIPYFFQILSTSIIRHPSCAENNQIIYSARGLQKVSIFNHYFYVFSAPRAARVNFWSEMEALNESPAPQAKSEEN